METSSNQINQYQSFHKTDGSCWDLAIFLWFFCIIIDGITDVKSFTASNQSQLMQSDTDQIVFHQVQSPDTSANQQLALMKIKTKCLLLPGRNNQRAAGKIHQAGETERETERESQQDGCWERQRREQRGEAEQK